MTSNTISARPAVFGEALPDSEWQRWRKLPALQQPEWEDAEALAEATAELARRPPLVAAEEIRTLGYLLAEVAEGLLHVVQAGDCAEDPLECQPEHVIRKTALLDALAGMMALHSLRPAVQVGRMAGQFGKPRSSSTEVVGGVELPVYRGHLVNAPEADPELRRPDPRRLLSGHDAAATAMDALRSRSVRSLSPVDAPVWTSHEALVLDYELPQLRRDEEGRPVLTSTHWPWIGDRTRQLDGAHVALLASVANPVACKVGPTMDRDGLLALCERLDPDRTPGRLTLISRMGADRVGERLPGFVHAVREAGHPVIWLCDPMHGNTVGSPDGFKTRLVTTVIREVEEFQKAVTEAGGTAGGLHLETTPDEVSECVHDASQLDRVGDKYTSLCDPRLNPDQALEVAAAWRI
ncbi:3-deoxy-7-phosphoheptulonate synthase [Streptomyces sp. NPDC006274]|uniref:3-deoxy-7-phosphoheptulonate synthase n=1 Tax=unclassified Streptomyces TaxID=2593676 RepID=UPI00339E99FE